MLRMSRYCGRGGAYMDFLLLAIFLILAYVFVVRRSYMNNLDETERVEVKSSGHDTRPPTRSVQNSVPAANGDPQHTIDARIKKLPDARPTECKSQKMDAKGSVSVVTKFFDYEFFDLKMTISSILMNTDPKLLSEIIIIDDGSSLEYIVDAASKYFPKMDKVKMMRNNNKLGASSARMKGFRASHGDIVVFVDTSVIVTKGWLEPLMDHLAKTPKSIAVPHFDGITNPIDYEYSPSSDNLVASMTWSLTVRMAESKEKTKVTDPIKSPMLRGNLFAVQKSFFDEIGRYDEGMADGGGENLELSLRTWMCGGKIHVVPCSRIGILNLRDPVKIIAGRNFRRVAELWLGQSKSLAFRNAGVLSDMEGEEQKSFKVRKDAISDMKCNDIDWFFKNVAGNLPTPSEKAMNFGLLKCRTGGCAHVEKDTRIELGKCNPEDYSFPPNEMFFEFDSDNYLTSNGKCLTVNRTAYVLAEGCRNGDSQQKWQYKDFRLINEWSHYCLMHVTDPDKELVGKRQIVMAQDCSTATDSQFAEFDFLTL